MSERICSVEGCLRKHEGLGYCALHYQRVKSGIPLDLPPMRVRRDSMCAFQGCDRDQLAKGYCALHYQRMKSGRPLNAFVRVVDDPTSYKLAHRRITAARGPARFQACVDCGGRAADWSYDGGCPRERTEAVRGRAEVAYSPDPMRYSARCKSCHIKRDAALRKGSA